MPNAATCITGSSTCPETNWK